MDNSTQSASSGSPAGAGAATATISTLDPESKARLLALVAKRGPAVRIRLRAPDDFDVTGNLVSGAALTLDVVDEDDTEGHTISLHFPKIEDAKQFEQRLIATGVIAGTLVIGGGGLAMSQALTDAGATTTTQTQVEATTGQPVGEPAHSGGISPSTGGALNWKEEALLSEIAGPGVDTTAGAQLGNSASGEGLSGKQEALLQVILGPDAAQASENE